MHVSLNEIAMEIAPDGFGYTPSGTVVKETYKEITCKMTKSFEDIGWVELELLVVLKCWFYRRTFGLLLLFDLFSKCWEAYMTLHANDGKMILCGPRNIINHSYPGNNGN